MQWLLVDNLLEQELDNMKAFDLVVAEYMGNNYCQLEPGLVLELDNTH